MEDGWGEQSREEAAEDLREGLASPSAGREGQVPASLSSRHPDLLRMVWFGLLRQDFPMEPRMLWNLKCSWLWDHGALNLMCGVFK